MLFLLVLYYYYDYYLFVNFFIFIQCVREVRLINLLKNNFFLLRKKKSRLEEVRTELLKKIITKFFH